MDCESGFRLDSLRDSANAERRLCLAILSLQSRRGDVLAEASFLGKSWTNGRRLFFGVTLATCGVVLLEMTRTDLSDPEGISSLIQLSVRLSVPWLYLAFAASSVRKLSSHELGRWWLRNRRIFGLCFAMGMGWQAFFILWMVIGHSGYYAEEVYSLADISVQIPGYLFLIAMTVTSFKPTRRKLSLKQWQWLHKIGIYFLWATVWSTYWYELYYYDDIQLIDHVYYWLGFFAWATRISAWAKRRGWPTVRPKPARA